MKPTAPAEAMVLCRPVPEPASGRVDDVLIAYADTLDVYRDCATRHRALVKALEGSK